MSMIELGEMEKRVAEKIDPDKAATIQISPEAGGAAYFNMAQVMEFAKLMAISHIAIPKHLRGNVGACLAVTIQAIEWRLSPFAVANKSYNVNDRLVYESQLIQAVILQRAPIAGRFKVSYSGEGDKRVCKVEAELKSGGHVEYSSPAFGLISPKNSPLWKSDPDQQQFYYSGRALCRRHFPDVLLGIYDREELLPEGDELKDGAPPRQTLSEQLDALSEGKDEEDERGLAGQGHAERAFAQRGGDLRDEGDREDAPTGEGNADRGVPERPPQTAGPRAGRGHRGNPAGTI